MMNEKQIRDRIFFLKKEIEILESVLNTKRVGFGRPKGSLKYTAEQKEFLIKNKDMKMSDLVLKFNKKFKTDYPKETRAFYNFMYRENIIFPKKEVNLSNWGNNGKES